MTKFEHRWKVNATKENRDKTAEIHLNDAMNNKRKTVNGMHAAERCYEQRRVVWFSSAAQHYFGRMHRRGS